METENMLENSRKKLKKMNVDMICANNLKVEGAGFGVDTNVLTLITEDQTEPLPLMSKDAAAGQILDQALTMLNRNRSQYIEDDSEEEAAEEEIQENAEE